MPETPNNSRLRCKSASHTMQPFLEDLVLRMLIIGQHRNVKQRRDIVHDLIAHEGVSVDDGDGLGVARLASHIRKPFQNRIVPPSFFHQVAARSSIASTRFFPRLDRHDAIVARPRQRSGYLSRHQPCCEELRPRLLALALCRLRGPRGCNSVADRWHVQVPLRIVAGRLSLLQLTGFRS